MSVAADRRTRFDRAYYQRYYFDPHTAVASRSEMRARARLIAALVAHMGLPVRRILEAGCGTGMLRTELRRLLPRAHYVALESSEYLCRRYGYLHGRIEEYRARAPFDLLICYDVLQYLPGAAAERALANFGRLCRAGPGVLGAAWRATDALGPGDAGFTARVARAWGDRGPTE